MAWRRDRALLQFASTIASVTDVQVLKPFVKCDEGNSSSSAISIGQTSKSTEGGHSMPSAVLQATGPGGTSRVAAPPPQTGLSFAPVFGQQGYHQLQTILQSFDTSLSESGYENNAPVALKLITILSLVAPAPGSAANVNNDEGRGIGLLVATVGSGGMPKMMRVASHRVRHTVATVARQSPLLSSLTSFSGDLSAAAGFNGAVDSYTLEAGAMALAMGGVCMVPNLTQLTATECESLSDTMATGVHAVQSRCKRTTVDTMPASSVFVHLIKPPSSKAALLKPHQVSMLQRADFVCVEDPDALEEAIERAAKAESWSTSHISGDVATSAVAPEVWTQALAASLSWLRPCPAAAWSSPRSNCACCCDCATCLARSTWDRSTAAALQ